MRTCERVSRSFRLRDGHGRGALGRIAALVIVSLVAAPTFAQSAEELANRTQQDSIIDGENCRLGLPSCSRGGAASGPRIGYDPCYLEQNAMRPCNSEQRQSVKLVGVDPKIAGTWEFPLEHGPWVLEIFRNGTYRFHSEAGDGAASHAGTFSARDGHWFLKATTGYTDGGTYTLRLPNTWVATGRLGTGAWHRHSSKVESSEVAESPVRAKP